MSSQTWVKVCPAPGGRPAGCGGASSGAVSSEVTAVGIVRSCIDPVIARGRSEPLICPKINLRCRVIFPAHFLVGSCGIIGLFGEKQADEHRRFRNGGLQNRGAK